MHHTGAFGPAICCQVCDKILRPPRSSLSCFLETCVQMRIIFPQYTLWISISECYLYAHRFDFNSSSGQSVVYLATDLDCIHNLDCPGPYGPVCANNSCLLECQPHQIQTDDGNCSLSIETSWFKGYRCVKKNQ